MCKLQLTTFACGHQRKLLLRACAFAQRLVATTSHRAPSFCINGLAIQYTTLSSDLCGRSNNDAEPCAEVPELMALHGRECDVRKEFEAYAQRVRSVSVCMRAREGPECNWWQVKQDGLDVGGLRKEHDVVWCETLPACLKHVEALLTETGQQLRSAAKDAVDALLERAHSDASSDLHADDTDYPVLQSYAHTVQSLRADIQRELHTLECYAVIACLDGVGWRLPNDEEDEELTELVKGRVMKPLNGGVEGWGERWMQVCTTDGTSEWVDRLDVAE